MKKITLLIAITATLASLLSACGEKSITEPTESHASVETSNTTTSTSVASTDEIKWDEVKDPLINDKIKEKLKAAIDAIVIKDADKFHQAIGKDLGTAHDYLLNNTMKFTSLNAAHQEREKVLVEVHGQLQVVGDTQVKEANYTFYFKKNPEGEWEITTID